MTIDRVFIRKAVQSGAEDGGTGSGNFGHKGRPGLRGGSGKGDNNNTKAQPKTSPIESLEPLRGIAEQSESAAEFWYNLNEEQQALFKKSGIPIKEAFESLNGGNKAERPEWKPPNPGSPRDFGIHYDYSDKPVRIEIIPAKSEGWQAEAPVPGVVKVREDGLGDNWEVVMAHEMGHQLSNYCPELARTIIMNPDDSLGRYNMRLQKFDGFSYSPEESWAQCVAYYVVYPDHLKKIFPKAYEAVEAFFEKSPSARAYVERGMKEYRKQFPN